MVWKVADEELVFHYRELVSKHNQVVLEYNQVVSELDQLILERDDAKECALVAEKKAKHLENVLKYLKENHYITEWDIKSFDFKE